MAAGLLDSNRAAGLLAEETARARNDRARIAHPRMPWLEPQVVPDGEPARDVLVVGGIQSGLGVGTGLLSAQRPSMWTVENRLRYIRDRWHYTSDVTDDG
jgi:hypothetical protein